MDFTLDDVKLVTEREDLWDLGNEVLYKLCEDHPTHTNKQAIIAKIWLIGRSYSAAIERRKNAEENSDDFYDTTVVEKMLASEIDEWLNCLPAQIDNPWTDLGVVVTTHKKLVDLFYEITGLEKRSLASKYLHFHRRDLFFIYDSRAREAIAKITPRIKKDIIGEEFDPEYKSFVRRCQYLKEDIENKYGTVLSPRQIDKLLLIIHKKMTNI